VNDTPREHAASLYDAVGGMPFFERLVDEFYVGVVSDPVLLPLYPQADLDGARRRLRLFLAQYWGGPATYSDERGHPRLRMRHFPFTIGPRERDHWLAHMSAAVERALAAGIPVADDEGVDHVRGDLMAYFVSAAEAMRNDTGLPVTSASYPKQRESR
jgi:hemoglobin